MQEEKYLNEEKYQQNKDKVKRIGKGLLIAGICALVIGIGLIILGFVGFGNAAQNTVNHFYYDTKSTGNVFGSLGLFITGGFVSFIGFGLTIGGAISMVIAHRREITAFTVQQTMPIAKEGIEAMTPTLENAAESISRGITRGKELGKNDLANK